MSYRVVQVLDGPIDINKWIRVKETGQIIICQYEYKYPHFSLFMDTINLVNYREEHLENVIIEEIED